MKKILIVIFVTLVNMAVYTQDCEITVTGSLPSCPGSLLVLSVPNSDTLDYHWTPGDYTSSSIAVYPGENITYMLHVFNDSYNCYDTIDLEVYPKTTVDFTQKNEDRTCTGIDADCQGKVEASAGSSFEPVEYTYEWQVPEWNIDPQRPWFAIGLCGDITYNIRVEDPNGCFIDTSYKVRSFLSPEIEITTDPSDTIFLQNPWLDFYFENLSSDTLGITNWSWDFGDTTTSTQEFPRHMFDRADEFNVQLFITDDHGCDTAYVKTILVKPVELIIPNAFTPNSDGINDTFTITGTEDPRTYNDNTYFRLEKYYLSNELIILNRYGKKVFEKENYENDWDGGNLPQGVYFYVLYCHGQFRDDTYKGSVSIFR